MALDVTQLLEDVATAKAERRADAAQKFKEALQGRGLIRHRGDLAGVTDVMRIAPGPFPKSGITNDNEIRDFLDYAEQDPDGLYAPYFTGRRGSAVLINDPRNDTGFDAVDFFEDHELWGFGDESATASAAVQTDTFTVTGLAGEYKDAFLLIDTDGGLVRKITSVQTDAESALTLGPGSFLPAEAVDLANFYTHPQNIQRVGMYLGDLDDSLSVTVSIRPSTRDILWGVSLYAHKVKGNKSNDERMSKGARGGSRMPAQRAGRGNFFRRGR